MIDKLIMVDTYFFGKEFDELLYNQILKEDKNNTYRGIFTCLYAEP